MNHFGFKIHAFWTVVPQIQAKSSQLWSKWALQDSKNVRAVCGGINQCALVDLLETERWSHGIKGQKDLVPFEEKPQCAGKEIHLDI